MSICKKIIMLMVSLSPHVGFALQERKAGLDFFDHVYTINLKSSVERKQHIIKEFARVGIKNYEIFEATDKNSPELKDAMKSGLVKKYPPCFRCGKVFCHCTNNVLIKPQIGNWLSFIRVFQDIIKNNYQFVLITEDDIEFTKDAQEIFTKLINDKSFASQGIDLDKPLIIRFYGKFDTASRDISAIRFDTNPQLSNPCFMVNKRFAESFVHHLHSIYTTSDIYIHLDLPQLDQTIQHFSVYPKPVYELSYGETASGVAAQFNSTINFSEKTNNKRMEFREYLLSKILFWRE